MPPGAGRPAEGIAAASRRPDIFAVKGTLVLDARPLKGDIIDSTDLYTLDLAAHRSHAVHIEQPEGRWIVEVQYLLSLGVKLRAFIFVSLAHARVY